MKIVYSLFLFMFSYTAGKGQAVPADGDTQPPPSRVLRFYPNPATSIINFDFLKEPGDKSYNFQIFSFVGKKVYEMNNLSAKTVVNLSDFYRGIYIFQLRDRNGRILDSGKFQVSK